MHPVSCYGGCCSCLHPSHACSLNLAVSGKCTEDSFGCSISGSCETLFNNNYLQQILIMLSSWDLPLLWAGQA